MPRKTQAEESAPLLGPQTREEWVRATLNAMYQKNVTSAAREEYRKLLEELPEFALGNGDLPTLYWRAALDRFESQPIVQESVKFELAAMRKRLASESSTPLELLLIDAIVACFADFWAFNMIYTKKTISSFTLSDMEQWERILVSKEGYCCWVLWIIPLGSSEGTYARFYADAVHKTAPTWSGCCLSPPWIIPSPVRCLLDSAHRPPYPSQATPLILISIGFDHNRWDGVPMGFWLLVS